jgi:hypothetical protein
MLSALGAQRDVKLWGRRAGAYMACEWHYDCLLFWWKTWCQLIFDVELRSAGRKEQNVGRWKSWMKLGFIPWRQTSAKSDRLDQPTWRAIHCCVPYSYLKILDPQLLIDNWQFRSGVNCYKPNQQTSPCRFDVTFLGAQAKT